MVDNHIVSRKLNSLVIYSNFSEFYAIKWVIYSVLCLNFNSRYPVSLILKWSLIVKARVLTLVKQMFFMNFNFEIQLHPFLILYRYYRDYCLGTSAVTKPQFITALVPYLCIILVMYIPFCIFVSFKTALKRGLNSPNGLLL